MLVDSTKGLALVSMVVCALGFGRSGGAGGRFFSVAAGLEPRAA